jgi:hypothetical protein
MASLKKWPAYVINLDKSTDRWAHMQAEFKDTVFNLERFPAYADPQNRGWIGVARSYFDIVKAHMKTDPEFNNLFIVFEDDAISIIYYILILFIYVNIFYMFYVFYVF